jgi:hypothetical protein
LFGKSIILSNLYRRWWRWRWRREHRQYFRWGRWWGGVATYKSANSIPIGTTTITIGAGGVGGTGGSSGSAGGSSIFGGIITCPGGSGGGGINFIGTKSGGSTDGTVGSWRFRL